MPQAAIGTIDPTTLSGTDLAALLTSFGTAIESGNSGTSRPSYIGVGGFWADTSTSGQITLKVFLGGTLDASICTINLSSGAVSLLGTSTLSGTSSLVPNTRNVNTANSLTGGGALNADLSLQLVGDAATPGNTYYYGTNASGTKGFWPFSGMPKTVYQRQTWQLPGSYVWVVPGNVAGIELTLLAGGSSSGRGGAINVRVPVIPGATYNIIVGSGNVNAGDSTQTSSFSLAATVIANATANEGYNVQPGISFDTTVPTYTYGASGYTYIDNISGGPVVVPGTSGVCIIEWITYSS